MLSRSQSYTANSLESKPTVEVDSPCTQLLCLESFSFPGIILLGVCLQVLRLCWLKFQLNRRPGFPWRRLSAPPTLEKLGMLLEGQPLADVRMMYYVRWWK